MKIFADTANIDEIKRINDLGLLDGVTTNPTIIAREGKDWETVEKEICAIVDGPVSAEVTADDTDGMVTQARKLSKWADNIVVKIPMTEAGLKAVNILSKEGIKTNVTLVFSAAQVALAGCDIATIPGHLIPKLWEHPLTDKGLATFKKDWAEFEQLQKK